MAPRKGYNSLPRLDAYSLPSTIKCCQNESWCAKPGNRLTGLVVEPIYAHDSRSSALAPLRGRDGGRGCIVRPRDFESTRLAGVVEATLATLRALVAAVVFFHKLFHYLHLRSVFVFDSPSARLTRFLASGQVG